MDKFPEFYRSMSERLFAVMDAIGVSEDIVYRRRHAYLKQESMRSIFYQLSEINIKTYHFGSQTEGTTTPEMDSDLDTLDCQQNFNVITDNSYWKTGKENMSIIQNDLTPPGHCRLHEVDFSSESEDYPHEECLFDEENRLILPNTFAVNVEKSAFEYLGFGYERHGPSGSPFPDKDIVNGFLCLTWPLDSSLWLGRPRALHWLSSEVIAEVLEGGCFIVSVGHPESENEKVEWRVSFSKSERVLTFNINITQIKCYVLLKLIKNEVLKLIAGDQFTSYHCKLVLLFTIERLPTGLWVSENLLSCLFMCLKTMQMFFISGYCPHVFNPAVNLFAGKITLNVRLNLLTCITSIINDDVRCLLSLKSDSLGNLLALYSSRVNIRSMTCSSDSALKTEKLIIGKLAYDEHVSLCGDLFSVLSYTIKPEHSVQECIKRIINHMKNSFHYFTNGDSYEKASAQMFVAYLCSFLASLYVAYSKDHLPKFVYSLVDVLYKLSESSLGIDVTSSKLKLATLYYHKGDLQKASNILKTIENMFENHVTPICGNCDCNDSPHKEFVDTVFCIPSENVAKTCIAHCVSFLRQEFPCCPFALRYEMYRSTSDDIRNRKEGMQEWMDWAEVDAQPYLYFLQFLIYKRMNDEDLQYEAMFKLASLLQRSPPIYHPETAFNLLGQCWEMKNNLDLALMCYDTSLRLVDINNAAKWHLAKLVYRKLCGTSEFV